MVDIRLGSKYAPVILIHYVRMQPLLNQRKVTLATFAYFIQAPNR